MNISVPEGWPVITPRIFTEDPQGLVGFILNTFEAEGEYLSSRPSAISIGGSLVMISGIEFRGSFPACLYVYVADVDATYKRAIDGGAESLEEPQDTAYGDRRGIVGDSWGNIWQIASFKGR
ncbi:MAG: VOC family protein [Proteobacteria bacterium]|nr:VOC family protein [Pseudomonadota bacterium]